LDSDLINPDALLIPGRSQAFLEIYLPSKQRGLSIAPLAETLLKANEMLYLNDLAPYVASSPKELKVLQQMVAVHPEIPKSFQEAVVDALYKSYQANQFRIPPSSEVKEIGEILKRSDHKRFLLIYLCWSHQFHLLQQEIAALDAETYRWFASTALNAGLVTPETLLIPGYGQAFLDVYLHMQREQIIPPLAESLLRVQEPQCLDRLIPYIARQTERELGALQKIIITHPEVPEDFQKAVSEAVAALHPTKNASADSQQPTSEIATQRPAQNLWAILKSLFRQPAATDNEFGSSHTGKEEASKHDSSS